MLGANRRAVVAKPPRLGPVGATRWVARQNASVATFSFGVSEMALDKATVKEDPREKLKALRAEFAKKSADGLAAAAASELR